jgi:hypothetical protein
LTDEFDSGTTQFDFMKGALFVTVGISLPAITLAL